MSARPSDRLRPAEAVGGLLAATSIFVSLIALAYRPMRVTPFTIAVALIAAGMGGRHNRLATFAVGVGALCWFFGLTIAILLGKPIY
jgi:hypothetical protein